MLTDSLSIQYIIIHHDYFTFAREGSLISVLVLIKMQCDGDNLLVPENILIGMIFFVEASFLYEPVQLLPHCKTATTLQQAKPQSEKKLILARRFGCHTYHLRV